LIGQFIAALG